MRYCWRPAGLYRPVARGLRGRHPRLPDADGAAGLYHPRAAGSLHPIRLAVHVGADRHEALHEKDPEDQYQRRDEDPLQPEFGATWGNLFDVLQDRAGAEPLRYLSWYLIEKPSSIASSHTCA